MTSEPSQSIHIVKRLGRIGGMETYVWELCHQLSALGHKVKIIYEKQCTALTDDKAGNIELIPVGGYRPFKPRWISMALFAKAVDKKLSQMDTQNYVIHSHERSLNHDVTTFHGGSIKDRNPALLDTLSPRIRTWVRLEKNELLGISVKRIFPVSQMTKSILATQYPNITTLLSEPAYPGVSPEFFNVSRSSKGKTLGFIGVEWHRKGLDRLVKAVQSMRLRDPSISLLVAGCDLAKVRHLFQDWNGGHELVGWINPQDFYKRIDVLVLPARLEPFGMVVAEANAAGIPAVVSTNCGISSLMKGSQGRVVDLEQDVALDNQRTLIEACEAVLMQKSIPEPMGLDWRNLAEQYALAYREVLLEKKEVQSTMDA